MGIVLKNLQLERFFKLSFFLFRLILYAHIFQDGYRNGSFGMETINAVNFEDLFDFSPEPVDRGNHEDRDLQPSPVTILPVQAPPNSYSSSHSVYIHEASANTANRNTTDVFADFDAITWGLLGNADLKRTSLEVTATKNSPQGPQSYGRGNYLHQSQHSSKQSGGELQLSGSVPVHWGNNEGPQSKYSNNGSTSVTHQQSETSSSHTTSSSDPNGRSNFAVAASITELLKDLPESLVQGGGERKGDSNRSSFCEETPQQPVKSKRGRKPGQTNLKTDMKSKLERSRQSARECRARKKLRYQYLDDLILERERANVALRDELLKYQKWCHELDKGRIPEGVHEMIKNYKEEQAQAKR